MIRVLLSIITLLFVPVVNAQAGTTKEIQSFDSNPGNLKMFVYASKHSKDTVAKPLVVVLHGCGQTAGDAAKLTGWNKLADLNDLIVLYPQQRITNNPNLCFNWFIEGDITKGKGESESIRQMIEYAQHNYNIDSTKIIITGLSAGAAMSVAMMATHPQMFSHGAIFAGGAYKLETRPAHVLKAMAGKKDITRDELVKNVMQADTSYKGKFPMVMIFQGTKDIVVAPKNAKLLIDQWTGVHQCDTIADKIDAAYQDKSITRKEYRDKDSKPAVIYYEVSDLGHQLLVDPGSGAREGGQTGIFGADRNFHSTYEVAKESGLIKKEE